MQLLDLVIIAVCAGAAIPALVFCFECLLALLPMRRSPDSAEQPSVVIVMPAHNESAVIEATVKKVLADLDGRTRLLVVADNCADDTAAKARSQGAEVIERHDTTQRGKGFALAHGFDSLAGAPPDIVVVLDADCEVTQGGIARIAALSKTLNCPVQADYLLIAPPKPSPRTAISALAFLVRNRVRPLGLKRIGVGCHLMGSGMAFPWEVIRNAPHQKDNLVEDLAMGIDLAIMGFPAYLCQEVRVTSELPEGGKVAEGQRTRWEHGHLATITTQVPKLLKAALARLRPSLFMQGMDLAVPPLAMLVALLVGCFALSAAWALLTQHSAAFVIACSSLAAVGGCVILAWARHAREVISARTLLSAPFYVLWKIPMYFSFLTGGRQKTWVRTERTGQGAGEPPKSPP
jgi:cellulose synthase/poly-beta-1,6-N-acetylglucosamine synthase-like glycosyltransferase